MPVPKFKRMGADKGYLFATDADGILYVGKPGQQPMDLNWIALEDKDGKGVYERVPGFLSSVEISDDELRTAREWQSGKTARPTF